MQSFILTVMNLITIKGSNMTSLFREIEIDVLDGAAHLLVDRQLWVDAKMFASDVLNIELTHSERHCKIKADLQIVFKDIEPILLDIISSLALLFVSKLPSSKDVLK